VTGLCNDCSLKCVHFSFLTSVDREKP
jgi:hypothetical protein